MPALAIADETIGALSFFRDHADDLDEDDINADQCLADVTIIAILRYRARIDLGALKHRLTHAFQHGKWRIAAREGRPVMRGSTQPVATRDTPDRWGMATGGCVVDLVGVRRALKVVSVGR